jgi:Phosphotransferase enzyme family
MTIHAGVIVLRMTLLPPFISPSFPRNHLSLTNRDASFSHLNASWFTADIFNPPAEEITQILEALASLPCQMGNIAAIGQDLMVKRSRATSTEAMAMIYIQRMTSIPVPTVRFCFQHADQTYIVMDRIKGQSLDKCLPGMTVEEMRNVAHQLARFVSQLRALDPGRPMGSWPSGPYDNLLFDPPPLQAFHHMKEFHSYWIWRLGPWLCRPKIPLSLCDGDKSYNIQLTHGDLAPRNIMVEGGEITGVLDWETFGWYPEFWEIMAALRASKPEWRQAVTDVFGPEMEVASDYRAVLGDVFSPPWAA